MNPISLLRSLIVLALLAGAQSAAAISVNWGSTRLATNYTSDLQPLGQAGDFVFEVGAFQPGFVPSAENIGQWEANWVAAGRSDYHTGFSFAAGSAQIVDAIADGTQGYIWGFDSRDGTRVEWILVSDPNWRWQAGGATSQPVDWTVGSAGQAVVGSIGAPGDGFHMRTAALAPGSAPAAEAWRQGHFAGELDQPHAAWGADADADGVVNALEYAFGTSPRDASQAVYPSASLVSEGGQRYMVITFDAEPGVPGLLSVEVSEDLSAWSPAGAGAEISIAGGRLEIRDTRPLAAGRRFFRLGAEL